MSFIIHVNQNSYTSEQFVKEKFSDTFVIGVQNFIINWLHDLPFTFHSSGSTGVPKAFVFRKWQLRASAQNTIGALGLNAGEQHILLCLNPMFVGGAMMIARALELDCELTLITPGSNVLRQVDPQHPYTFVSFVPMQLLLPDFDFQKFNRFRQVLIGGSHISKTLENRLLQTNSSCYHTYGMTETLSHIALRKIGESDSFLPLKGTEIKLNENSCIRLKVDFLKDWIETHDIAEIRDDGRFTIKGRTDFVINSGAFKIHPEQVEFEMEEIIESEKLKIGSFMLGALNDEMLGQKCVSVFHKFPEKEDYEKLILKLGQRVQKYCLPKEICVLNTWPLLENGKIDRKKIIELINNQAV